MRPTLVILAAGLGSRYGHLKQMEVVGAGGATIMDYSIHDALRAGFGKIVFVIRPELQADFRAVFGRRYEPRVSLEYACQRLDALPSGLAVPPGRTRPWGTGQAVLTAEPWVKEPFAVVNADDFYGAEVYTALSAALRLPPSGDVPTYALVGFALGETLTETGPVNRGWCRCTRDGWLERIVEITGIAREGADGWYMDESGQKRTIRGSELVSMNAWGFQPVVFEQLRAGFECFLGEYSAVATAEFHLPSAVTQILRAGAARVRVLPGGAAWFGITHPEDKPRVTEMISALVRSGRYPAKLWD